MKGDISRGQMDRGTKKGAEEGDRQKLDRRFRLIGSKGRDTPGG